jgi:excisionase family DNA binding protein
MDTARRYAPPRTDPMRLLTIPQTADVLAVSRATVYRLLEDGVLRSIRVRSRMRVAEADVRDLIERSRAEAAER